MGMFDQLGDLLYNLVYLVLYPAIRIFNMLLNAVISALDELRLLYHSIIGLGYTVSNLIINTFGVLFPATWTTLILLGVVIVVVLRVYFFVKDISIAGFKI